MFVLFVFFAALVQTINELTFGRVFGEGKQFPKLGFVLMYTALAFGLVFAFVAKITMVTWVSQTIGGIELQLQWVQVDYFISGVLISGGGIYLHQFLSNYAPQKKPNSAASDLAASIRRP